MTRNTKIYKTVVQLKAKKAELIYRDLTIEELSFLNNIKNKALRSEFAAKLAITNYNVEEIPWQILTDIGDDVLKNSESYIYDENKFNIYVSKYRNLVKEDSGLIGIQNILNVFPNISILELFKLTHLDIIELVCFCESLTGKKIFKVGNLESPKKKRRLINQENINEEPSLKEKIESLNNFLGE